MPLGDQSSSFCQRNRPLSPQHSRSEYPHLPPNKPLSHSKQTPPTPNPSFGLPQNTFPRCYTDLHLLNQC